MKTFKKLAMASGVAVALTGASLPSQAVIQGVAGEALLVPFVLFDSVAGINTLIQVTTPGAMGFDTIPAFFTAPNTTPTNANGGLVRDPDLGALGEYEAGLKIFVFDSKSEPIFDTQIPTSPDALTLINWGDVVSRRFQQLDRQKVYMIITNDKNLFDGVGVSWAEPARFAMFGNAYMIWNSQLGPIDAKIPVLAMSDGADLPGQTLPSTINNVIFNVDGLSIDAASPLTTGMRTSRDNGQAGDYMLFDLTMSNRFAPTLHVIWVDQNIGQSNSGLVFNDREQSCSQPLPIPNELNVIWTSIPELQPGSSSCGSNCGPESESASMIAPLPWVDIATELCYPGSKYRLPANGSIFDFVVGSDIFFPGFARFRINEYATNEVPTNAPTSAGAAFSIHLQVDLLDPAREELVFEPAILPVETSLAHQRGFFR